MGNKNIRDYVPGKNDFLSFAKTMNKNARIDFRKTGDEGTQSTEWGSMTSSPEEGDQASVFAPVQKAPAEATWSTPYEWIQSKLKSALDDGAKGVDTSMESFLNLGSQSGVRYNNFFNLSPQNGTNGSGTNDSETNDGGTNGTVTPDPVPNESGTNGTETPDPVPNESVANGTVTPTPAPNGSGANGTVTPDPVPNESGANGTATPDPAPNESGANGTVTPDPSTEKEDKDTWLRNNGLLSEQDWYANNGLDPDRDYQNAASMLNYEYQTAMATYGQKAEQLYQMGLSNSGVSDIFQANAFSAYLSSMNDANINRIQSKKQNKLLYDEYVRGMEANYEKYSAKWDETYDTNLNKALTYALENYNGYNLNDIISMLTAQGYDQGILDEVTSRLQNLNADQYKGATALSLVETIFTLMPNYSGSEKDQKTLKEMFGNAVDTNLLSAAINIANARVQASPSGQAQLVQNLVDEYYDDFNPSSDMNEFIKSTMKVETDKNAEGFDQTKYDNAVKAWEQMSNDYTNKVLSAYEFITKNIESMGMDIVKAYLKSQNFSDAIINQALSKFEESEGGKAWKEGQVQKSVENFVTTYGAQFDPNYEGGMDAFIQNVLGVKTDKNAEGFDQTKYNNAVKAWEQMNSSYEARMGEIDSLIYSLFRDNNGANTWEGSASQNQALKEFFTTQNLTEKEKQYVLNKLNERKEEVKDAEKQDIITGIKDIDAKDFNSKKLEDILKEAEDKYGKDSANYQEIVTAGSAKMIENINWMLETKPDGTPKNMSTAAVGAMVGFDADTWNSMDAGEQEAAIIEYAGELRANEMLTADDYVGLVSTYVTDEVKQFITTDNRNIQATGLQDAGSLVSQLLDWKNNGYLSKTEYNSQVAKIIDQMKFKLNGGQINWYGSVDGAEASVSINSWQSTVTDSSLIEKLNSTGLIIEKQGLKVRCGYAAYNGKLYYMSVSDNGDTWHEVAPDNMHIIGDGVPNSEAQREGIYEILVAILSPQTLTKEAYATQQAFITNNNTALRSGFGIHNSDKRVTNI